MSRGHDPHELSEPGDPHDEIETQREIDKNRPEDSFVNTNARIVQEAKDVFRDVDTILLQSEVESDVEETVFDSTPDFQDVMSDADKADETTRLLKDVLKELKTVTDKAKKADQPTKTSSIKRFVYIITGLSIVGGAAYGLYEIIRRSMKGKGDADIPVPDDVKAKIHELVQTWKDEADTVFWTNIANSIDSGLVIGDKKEAFTIADQLIFLSMTRDLCPLRDVWFWDSAKDVEDNAKAIKTFYDKDKKISDIYRHVLEVTYKSKDWPNQSQVMPRYIAAGQLQIVLGMIL
jgi:hypothetical protein